jgi:iron complex outermembrane recepter protein
MGQGKKSSKKLLKTDAKYGRNRHTPFLQPRVTSGAFMTSALKRRLLASVAATLVGSLAITTAQAQQSLPASTPANDAGLEVVIVTAQKRTENLQDTPISVSVLSARALENRSVTSLLDLGDGAIPSLKVAPFFTRGSALVMNVRGVGVMSDSNQPARDQGVGVYVDGIYLGRAQGLGTALFDVANIEVLKGPQGTLFGRNTIGGALNIVTRRPTGEFSVDSKFGLGNYEGSKAEVRVNLPRFNGISIKLDAVLAERNGWVDNPLIGAQDFGGFKKRGFQAQALWQPTQAIDVNYAFDTSYDGSSSKYFQLLERGGPLRFAEIAVAQPDRAKVATVGVPQQLSEGNVSGHRLTMDWRLSDTLTLKSISSVRDLKQGQFDNGAASGSMVNTTGNFTNQGFARYSIARFTQDQSSQEFQLVGNTQRLKYVLGALWYEENVQDDAQAFNTVQFTDAAGVNTRLINTDYAALPIDRASRVTTTATGVFAQATYSPAFLDNRLHLTLGARWSRDAKMGQLFIVNNALPVVDGVSAARDLDAAWESIDPLVNVAFDISDNIMIYGKWSTGHKSGGANSRSLRYAPFEPESVEMYEIGVKTEFWGRRGRLNISAYSGEYKDIQLDFFAQFTQINAVTGQLVTNLRTTSETINAPGTGDLSGVEVEFNLAPLPGLRLAASYAYNQAKIPATINPFRQAGGVFITVPVPIYSIYTPENSGSASVTYSRPLWGANFLAYGDVNFDDGYFANYTDVAYDPVTRAVTVKQPKGDSSLLVNARLSLADIALGKSNMTVSLWARNLLDREQVFYRTLSTTTGSSGIYNEPRTYGLEVSFRYN